jgi:hypothetical protein
VAINVIPATRTNAGCGMPTPGAMRGGPSNGLRVSCRAPPRPGAPVIEHLTDEYGRTNAILPRRNRAVSVTRWLGGIPAP